MRKVFGFRLNPRYIKIGNQLIEISELKYFIPLVETGLRFVVEAEGTAEFSLKSDDGKIDRLLTDIDLKRVAFSDDGDVEE